MAHLFNSRFELLVNHLTHMQWWLAAPHCLHPTPHGTETHADASETHWPDGSNTFHSHLFFLSDNKFLDFCVNQAILLDPLTSGQKIFKMWQLISHSKVFQGSHSMCFFFKRERKSNTCTMLLMTMGNILRGKRRMLNRARETNAFCASRILCSSTNTYTANVERATFVKETRRQAQMSQHNHKVASKKWA